MNGPSMYLLLTMVSVLALWAFLTALVVGLLLVLKPLEAIRGNMQRIAAGVRAIEQQTAPLADLGRRLPAAAEGARDALDPFTQQLQRFDQTIERHQRTLRRLRTL